MASPVITLSYMSVYDGDSDYDPGKDRDTSDEGQED